MENLDEIKMQENVDTATTMGDEGNPEQRNVPEEKSFNQQQVNDMIRERLERDRASFYKRYGVEDRNGLDNLIGKANSYEIMDERYNNALNENYQLKEKLAFMENNINPDKYDDIRAYFKGKGLEFNNDSLASELQTHQEWLNVAKEEAPTTVIKTLGNDNGHKNPIKDEKAEALKLFGL